MKNKLCGIYCIENMVNNKKYIGLSRDIERRWLEHKSELRRNEHNNQYLQSAWNKYGEDNFNFHIVELCEEKDLSDKEIYYIELYKSKSHEDGYNLTRGGEDVASGKLVISLNNLKIFDYVNDAAEYAGVVSTTMIDWCKNKQNYMYYDEYILLSNEEKEYWRNFDWDKYNHKKLSSAHSRENLSKETLLKYKQAISGKNNPRATKVYCPQLDEIFDYMQEAQQKYKVNAGSIGQCIKGKLKSAGIHPITGEKLTWVKL